MLVEQQFPDDPSNFDFNDPKAVDGLLAREMQQLDVKERNLLLEDAHGISSGNKGETLWVETPETIHKALNDLAEAINRIPSREKQAYLESTKLPSSYIHSKRFRLKCLRCTGFNIPFAADKVVSYCEVARNLFGDFILQRPVRLSDFNKRDLQFMRMGRLQYMPFGDRAGRRILVFFPDETQEAMPPLSKVGILLFGRHVFCQRRASNVKNNCIYCSHPHNIFLLFRGSYNFFLFFQKQTMYNNRPE